MKKRYLVLVSTLILTSIVFFVIHYLIFRDLHHIGIFLMHDIAFIPLEVLLVTIFLERALHSHEKENIMKKLNISIGVFFNEIGTEMLGDIIYSDRNVDSIRDMMIIKSAHKEKEVKKMKDAVKLYVPSLDLNKINLNKMNEILNTERDFLIGLLKNPLLMEHETFTDMLQAVFHLQDELRLRINEGIDLTDEDKYAIKKDIERVYKFLSFEWIIYLEYTIKEYPYLFLSTFVDNPYDNREREALEKEAYRLSKILCVDTDIR